MKKTISLKNAERFGWERRYAVKHSYVEYGNDGIADMGYLETLGEFIDKDEALRFLNESKLNIHCGLDETGYVEQHLFIEVEFYNKKGEWKGFEDFKIGNIA